MTSVYHRSTAGILRPLFRLVTTLVLAIALIRAGAGATGAPIATTIAGQVWGYLDVGINALSSMADVMSESFLAFGRTGNPNTAALMSWPPFSIDARPTMIFDLPLRVENDPRGAERKLLASPTATSAGSGANAAASRTPVANVTEVSAR